MTRTRARIGFFGLFGWGNFGNEGSLEAALRFVRGARPQTPTLCICVNPAEVRRAHGLNGVQMTWPGGGPLLFRALDKALLRAPRTMLNWVRAFRHVRDLAVMIVPGTGVLDDFASGPWGVPYDLFRYCAAAKLSGVKILFVSIGAGPIHHPLSRWMMKRAISMADYRSYRDARSKAYLESIGFRTRDDPITPDLAFALAPPGARARDAASAIGLGVMSYYGWRNDREAGAERHRAYLEKLRSFSEWALAQGWRVRLLIGETTDAETADTLRAMLGPARVEISPTASLHDLMRQIESCDIVAATRFHNVVCALKLGKPTLSLSYAAKNDVLLDEMGLGSFHQPVDDFTLDWLKAQAAALLAQRETLAAAIRARVAAYEGELDAQFARIEPLLPH